jgi:hypothetical protein
VFGCHYYPVAAIQNSGPGPIQTSISMRPKGGGPGPVQDWCTMAVTGPVSVQSFKH